MPTKNQVLINGKTTHGYLYTSMEGAPDAQRQTLNGSSGPSQQKASKSTLASEKGRERINKKNQD